jgi:hypothetical protein
LISHEVKINAPFLIFNKINKLTVIVLIFWGYKINFKPLSEGKLGFLVFDSIYFLGKRDSFCVISF